MDAEAGERAHGTRRGKLERRDTGSGCRAQAVAADQQRGGLALSGDGFQRDVHACGAGRVEREDAAAGDINGTKILGDDRATVALDGQVAALHVDHADDRGQGVGRGEERAAEAVVLRGRPVVERDGAAGVDRVDLEVHRAGRIEQDGAA